MQIEYIDGLLITSMTITHNGISKTIENVVIDTGATQSIISIDAVEELGIRPEYGDQIVAMFGIGGKEYAFRKRINRITFDRLNLEEFYVDFSKLDDQLQINGLIGLDILLKGKFIIDLNKRELYLPN